jgi:hypothetical protein
MLALNLPHKSIKSCILSIEKSILNGISIVGIFCFNTDIFLLFPMICEIVLDFEFFLPIKQ